jgi:hypothetical protein
MPPAASRGAEWPEQQSARDWRLSSSGFHPRAIDHMARIAAVRIFYRRRNHFHARGQHAQVMPHKPFQQEI